MNDQIMILLFCLGLAFLCSLTAAFFYQVSLGQWQKVKKIQKVFGDITPKTSGTVIKIRK